MLVGNVNFFKINCFWWKLENLIDNFRYIDFSIIVYIGRYIDKVRDRKFEDKNSL